MELYGVAGVLINADGFLEVIPGDDHNDDGCDDNNDDDDDGKN